MPTFKILLSLGLLALVAGCATPAKNTAMVPGSLSEIGLNESYSKSIRVAAVEGGKATNPLWTSQISSGAFKTSLENSLKARGYLGLNGPNVLTATLVDLKQPLVGTSLTVTSIVRYAMKNASGQSVFDQTITASYTAAFSDSLLAVERLRLANEGSARANIAKFIAALDKQ